MQTIIFINDDSSSIFTTNKPDLGEGLEEYLENNAPRDWPDEAYLVDTETLRVDELDLMVRK